MKESELLAAVAREDFCRYLSACFYEPDAAFEEENMFAALIDAASHFAPEMVPGAARLGEAFRRYALDDLLRDHTRLFLGPMQTLAKPYGSFWLDEEKTLMGNSTQALLDLYHEADFEMDEEFKDLPDHIAAELEFLYLLIFRENEAHRQGDDLLQATSHALRKRFLQQHLGAWVGKLSAAVQANAQTDFYRELADLSNRYVEFEAGNLGIL